jgi:hypothetical protein
MHDPPIVVVLDEEGVVWDQQLQQRHGIPTGLDVDLDSRNAFALIWLRFGGAPHDRITVATCHEHPSLLRAKLKLLSRCVERATGPTVAVWTEHPISRCTRPHSPRARRGAMGSRPGGHDRYGSATRRAITGRG